MRARTCNDGKEGGVEELTVATLKKIVPLIVLQYDSTWMGFFMLHSHGYKLSSYTISTRSGKGHTNGYTKGHGDAQGRGRLKGRARGIISRCEDVTTVTLVVSSRSF